MKSVRSWACLRPTLQLKRSKKPEKPTKPKAQKAWKLEILQAQVLTTRISSGAQSSAQTEKTLVSTRNLFLESLNRKVNPDFGFPIQCPHYEAPLTIFGVKLNTYRKPGSFWTVYGSLFTSLSHVALSLSLIHSHRLLSTKLNCERSELHLKERERDGEEVLSPYLILSAWLVDDGQWLGPLHRAFFCVQSFSPAFAGNRVNFPFTFLLNLVLRPVKRTDERTNEQLLCLALILY